MSNDHVTGEQRAVLDSKARITIVKAGPGSGKTRVFVEALSTQIQNRSQLRRVAALSFTNVAQEEIGRRIKGLDRTHHFLGTLDSFFLRFVVRPFAHLIGISEGVELVPASVQASIRFSTVQIGRTARERVPISDITFVGGTGDKPLLEFRSKWKREFVPERHIQTVLREKVKLWQHSRMITHSDSHFLAASILASKHGSAAIETVARRFPMLLIDEFQDTNWFHSRALMRLLGYPALRALIVGDPMQSIYQFGGADPAIFDEATSLDGASVYRLDTSHRCPRSVTNVLSVFAGSGHKIESSKTEPGRSVLLVHTLEKPAPDGSLIEDLTRLTEGAGEIMVLGRRDSTIEGLVGHSIEEAVQGSGVCERLHEASHRYLSGDSRGGADIVGQVLASFVLNEQRPTVAKIRQAGISMRQWRSSVFRVLEAAIGQPQQSWQEWSNMLRAQIEREVNTILGVERKLGAQIRTVKNQGFRLQPTARPTHGGWPKKFKFSNIHQVKGAEFDAIALFVPKPKRTEVCPSIGWWNETAEERRVAFVAMSRPKDTLIVCVHKETYQNLKNKRPQFVEAFETRYVGASQ